MLLRRLLLAVGAIALLFGVGLLLLSLRGPTTGGVAQAPRETDRDVLVAAKTVAAGSLLRPDDFRWQEVPQDQVLAGSFARGQVTRDDLIGAAARRDLRLGDQLVSDQIVRPNEPGFLPAALKPGSRAVTIAVNPAEVDAGLITPGDRVDVILTQSFNSAVVQPSHRSAAETVLRNLRIIAVDQTTHLARAQSERKHLIIGPSQAQGVPKTVTLEVTVRQAQELMLAGQLGKLQLSLRGFSDHAAGLAEAPAPTWASEVSPALASLDSLAGPMPALPAKPGAATEASASARYPYGAAIEVIRGTKVEQRCFDPLGRMTENCPTAGVIPASAAPAVPAARRPVRRTSPAS